MRMTLRLKLSLSSVVLLLLLVAATGFMIVGADRQRREVASAVASAEFAADTALDLMATVKRLNIDIIQIQQWLTDISATRGLDGLNDGFDKAAEAKAAALSELQRIDALVEAVAQIGVAIGNVDHISTTIAAAMEEQSAATQDIARSVSETADAASEVAQRIADVSREARDTGERAGMMRGVAGRVTSGVTDLRQTLIRVVRTATTDVDRRREERFDISMPCEVRQGGRKSPAVMVNASGGGALLSGIALPVGGRGELLVALAAGPIRFQVVAAETDSTSVAFDLDDRARDALAAQPAGAVGRSAA